VPGAEQYAKGWIESFHAYHGLGPPATHWSIEHFQKYSEDDLMRDVFEDVDVAIFQPTYLRRAGSYFVIGYGGTVSVPTLDIISTERNIIGNIVGTYNDLAELMVLAQAGRVTLHTRTYPLDAAADAIADLDAGRARGRAILVP
jgi:D-arabinose 1-dehydrogenase-like Zn-dependent alcohol dehydrogenase